ncbi:hypothetical protein MAR_024627 [Mya arenaria]|uniref:Transposase n=1 Tax=Mya arenaria TaxID=6604 RepID=A0ABY7DS81_MYAAR|nr:hypothetical protein MAR_024627 [Mya arenaria]
MPKLSNQERARAIGLIEGGASYNVVARMLNVHRTSVIRLLRKYRTTGFVRDLPRQPRGRTEDEVEGVDDWMLSPVALLVSENSLCFSFSCLTTARRAFCLRKVFLVCSRLPWRPSTLSNSCGFRSVSMKSILHIAGISLKVVLTNLGKWVYIQEISEEEINVVHVGHLAYKQPHIGSEHLWVVVVQQVHVDTVLTHNSECFVELSEHEGSRVDGFQVTARHLQHKLCVIRDGNHYLGSPLHTTDTLIKWMGFAIRQGRQFIPEEIQNTYSTVIALSPILALCSTDLGQVSMVTVENTITSSPTQVKWDRHRGVGNWQQCLKPLPPAASTFTPSPAGFPKNVYHSCSCCLCPHTRQPAQWSLSSNRPRPPMYLCGVKVDKEDISGASGNTEGTVLRQVVEPDNPGCPVHILNAI